VEKKRKFEEEYEKIPNGITAANKQAPILMHVEYQVRLPDHDWVVAERQKLIPSVVTAIEIGRDGLGKPDVVGYSGPTYIAIRSEKHSSSTALAHGLDFNRLLELPQFKSITKTEPEKSVKPVIIFTVNGGPDENPRYQKVIAVAIYQFLTHNLNALFVTTNTPGRSAYNCVRRKMAPLSKELYGLILPHDHFGSNK
jgi:hypothetical protein